jgi:hypothetical protein
MCRLARLLDFPSSPASPPVRLVVCLAGNDIHSNPVWIRLSKHIVSIIPDTPIF